MNPSKDSQASADVQQPQPDDIPDSDKCPICHLMLCQPVVTTCNHTMCSTCLEQWATTSRSAFRELVYSPIEDVSVRAPAVRNARRRREQARYKATCPLCRTPATAELDIVAANALRKKYPEYAAREAEEKAFQAQMGEKTNMTITIGNRHAPSGAVEGDENSHDWTMFVRSDRSDLISKVVYDLHPTFNPSTQTVTRHPFEFSALGWGEFEVSTKIHLRRGFQWAVNPIDQPNEPLTVAWGLHFADGGLQAKIEADVRVSKALNIK